MKKILFSTLIVFIFYLAGCSSESGKDGENLAGSSYTGQNASGEKRTITFKGNWQCEDNLVLSNGSQIIANMYYSLDGGSIRLYNAEKTVATGTASQTTLSLNYASGTGSGSWTLTKK